MGQVELVALARTHMASKAKYDNGVNPSSVIIACMGGGGGGGGGGDQFAVGT